MNPVDCTIQIWWFLLGAVVGSFLNVVIYRLPRGESLVWPPSHCPICRHSIRWFDNLPILSWVLLKGRCRDCGAPISVRYPLIELTAALVTGSVAWKVSGGGWTVAKPGPIPGLSGGVLDGLQTLAVASLLLTVLVVVAIFWDRKPVPLSLWWPAIILVVGTVLLSNALGIGSLERFFRNSYTSLEFWIALGGGLLGGALADSLSRIRLRCYFQGHGRPNGSRNRPRLANRNAVSGDHRDGKAPTGHVPQITRPQETRHSWDWTVGSVLWSLTLPGVTGLIPGCLALGLELTAWGVMCFRSKCSRAGRPLHELEGWLRSCSLLLAVWGTILWGLVLLWQ